VGGSWLICRLVQCTALLFIPCTSSRACTMAGIRVVLIKAGHAVPPVHAAMGMCLVVGAVVLVDVLPAMGYVS
jgi:hypothetical protein